MQRYYIAIDLKSFYASVECAERNLDPLDTNLIVADESRTDKTICLAVSPSMKKYGLPGRCRLFEARQKISEVNRRRKSAIHQRSFSSKTYLNSVLECHPEYELDCIIAPPQMAKYIKVSSQIYNIYLNYVSREDIHVYSIDEVFIDASPYLNMYSMSPRELAMKMIQDVLHETHITATAGIGTNLYLAKIAMDIVAKHIPADKDGVRIAELDEISFRKKLWNHKPLSDFWRIGPGIQAHLNRLGIQTMGDLARVSLGTPNDVFNQELLYKEFGINAELLIDHAWGIEPCTMNAIKNYKSKSSSVSQGQVLQSAYDFDKARIVIREMAETLSLELTGKNLLCSQFYVFIGYDAQSVEKAKHLSCDPYGRPVPKPVHGGVNFNHPTSSTSVLADSAEYIFEKIADRNLKVRRLNVCANNVVDEVTYKACHRYVQGELFETENDRKVTEQEKLREEKERNLQKMVIEVKNKYGKNAMLKAMNLQDGAMQITRNGQIGGHKA